MMSFDVGFKNIAEYFVDRSAWFNPGVLQDQEVLKLVKDRPELNNLQFVSVSLICARGLKLQLHFSEAVTASDWSQSSFNAHGGASFFGFSIGGGGGSSRSRTNIAVDTAGTTVTFQDDDNVVRVLGARVESFVAPTIRGPIDTNTLLNSDPSVRAAFGEFSRGLKSYLDLQKEKIAASKKQ